MDIKKILEKEEKILWRGKLIIAQKDLIIASLCASFWGWWISITYSDIFYKLLLLSFISIPIGIAINETMKLRKQRKYKLKVLFTEKRVIIPYREEGIFSGCHMQFNSLDYTIIPYSKIREFTYKIKKPIDILGKPLFAKDEIKMQIYPQKEDTTSLIITVKKIPEEPELRSVVRKLPISTEEIRED